LADFDFVTGRVATGGAIQSSADTDALVAAGISHVVDARAEMDDAPFFVAVPSISYLWDPTQDDGTAKAADWFGRAIEFCLSALAKPHTRCLLHCASGSNRGPSLAYSVLLAQGFPADVAEVLVRKARPGCGLAYKKDANLAIPILGYD